MCLFSVGHRFNLDPGAGLWVRVEMCVVGVGDEFAVLCEIAVCNVDSTSCFFLLECSVISCCSTSLSALCVIVGI